MPLRSYGWSGRPYCAAALGGKARTRVGDLLDFMEDAGVAALPIVAVVNILVGAVVAFVGALQLRRFGAETYIANLVGTAEVREMAPLATAIVMSGRTGSAYVAEIATMQGTRRSMRCAQSEFPLWTT
jgi:phospholipid/cholesterol/gamma-HCH transport system permease protein